MIDLTPFCGTDPFRPYIHKPFSRGEFTYATDGLIMVRLPRISEIADGGGIIKNPDAPLKGWETATYHPLPNADLPMARKIECSACQGRGHKHECETCECDCEMCRGTGEIFDRISVAIGGTPFALWLIQKMLALPCAEIAAGNKDGEPLLFRFDGGFGAVMPLRDPYEQHLTPFDRVAA